MMALMTQMSRRDPSTRSPRRDVLTDALLRIVADRGLDQVSVREVATAAGVSIGTVQHYFPTKDDMLAAAFGEVVRRTRERLANVRLSADVRRNLSAVLRELLPLDSARSDEARIHLAFASRAATAPALAAIQRDVLADVTEQLAEAFRLAAGGQLTTARCTLAAHAVLAVTDGLALHAVSTEPWLSRRRLTAILELTLDAVLPAPG